MENILKIIFYLNSLKSEKRPVLLAEGLEGFRLINSQTQTQMLWELVLITYLQIESSECH